MKSVDMDVVVLCGGMGTRLRSIVSDRPKPMAQIDNRPFLDILIEYLSSFGFRRFVLCTGHKSDIIREYYSDKQMPVEILISNEETPLGTAGAVKNAEAMIKSESFIVVNGDSFCSVDMQSFVDYHERSNAMVSVVLSKNKERRDGGNVIMDDMCRVCSFSEKDATCQSDLMNAGVYCFQREFMTMTPPNEKYSLEYDVFPKLAKEQFLGFVTDKPILDIGTPERLGLAKCFFEKSEQSVRNVGDRSKQTPVGVSYVLA